MHVDCFRKQARKILEKFNVQETYVNIIDTELISFMIRLPAHPVLLWLRFPKV